jgi:transcriptional regulator with XRE-family HTH domain
MEICEEIRLRRVLKGLSLSAVAKASGIHRVNLGRYERGIHVPRPQTYERIIAAIDRLAHTEDSKEVIKQTS